MPRTIHTAYTVTELTGMGLTADQLSDLYAAAWWAMCEAMRAGDKDRQGWLREQAYRFQEAGRLTDRAERDQQMGGR